MTRRDEISIDADLMQQLATKSGQQPVVDNGMDHLRLGSHLFVAPLSIPAQRKGEA